MTFSEFFSSRVVNGYNRVQSSSGRVALTVSSLVREFLWKTEHKPLDSDPRLQLSIPMKADTDSDNCRTPIPEEIGQ